MSTRRVRKARTSHPLSFWRAAAALLALLALVAPAARAQMPEHIWPQPPQLLYPGLFSAVQEAGLYADSKRFADAEPRSAPADILARYRARQPLSRQALAAFVEDRFVIPAEPAVPAAPPGQTPIRAHINGLWDTLTRRTPVVSRYSSQLALPQPYVVPGGRFREMYYWDTYFTMLGLEADGRLDLMQAMVRNFAYLIDAYGHIPNGMRTYYLSRSQPPFFFEMVRLLSPGDPDAALAGYLPELRREHAFWMEGGEALHPGQAHRRVVAMPDASLLNRYWDDLDLPRDESYREDTRSARTGGGPAGRIHRDLRAAAESGWDFSSRWFADGHTRASIETTQIIPVDLNSLLLGLEKAIAAACGRRSDTACAQQFGAFARRRQAAMDRYLWDPAAGVYQDYRWTTGVSLHRLSAATLYPLFEAGASAAQAHAVAAATARDLLKAGGLVTTTVATGEQWDAPNGWPPLQWIAIAGLRRYGETALAEGIACRFLVTVNQLYRRSGRLIEKYDVVNGSSGGGGEYPTQDGFGWTNGVVGRLMVLYPADAAYTALTQCPPARVQPGNTAAAAPRTQTGRMTASGAAAGR